MGIEKFEVGKKYKLIDKVSYFEENDSDYLSYFDKDNCIIFDEIDSDGDGWIGDTCVVDISEEGDWFTPVEESVPHQITHDNNVDAIETQSHPITPSVVENVPEDVTSCPIEQIKQLCSDHNVNIEISNKGEIYIHIENIDNTYKVCDMKQLTQVLDSVKLLESFKEG
tara:strand:+ start:774 stop:1277 length:504 start_codon:yes stop_codon:yes gene_type:complete